MWRVASILCLTAVVAEEITLEKLSTTVEDAQKTADHLQSEVTTLSQKMAQLSAVIPTLPAKMAAAQSQGAEAVAQVQKDFKADQAKLCTLYDSLSKVDSDIGTSSKTAKDMVTQVQAQVTSMAKDTSKAESGAKYLHYLAKYQKAIMVMDSASTAAKTYVTPAMAEACKPETEAAATRLYLAMKPNTESSKFHLPSALLGAVVGAAVVGAAAFSFFRAKGKSGDAARLMEEGSME